MRGDIDLRESLLNPTDRASMMARLEALRPDARKRWGRMSVGGMLCHLTDAFEVVLGDRPADRRPKFHERTVMRLVALHTPIPWPHGVKTVPACDQELGGTPPGEFERDRAALRDAMERFIDRVEPDRIAHPIFGRMSADEWGRWVYRHMDHHLRQFSG